MVETITEISRKACMSHFSGTHAFSDVFTDWLLAKGVKVTSEMIDKINDLHRDWYHGKGLFYTHSGRYRRTGKHQLGEIIVKELNITVSL